MVLVLMTSIRISTSIAGPTLIHSFIHSYMLRARKSGIQSLGSRDRGRHSAKQTPIANKTPIPIPIPIPLPTIIPTYQTQSTHPHYHPIPTPPSTSHPPPTNESSLNPPIPPPPAFIPFSPSTSNPARPSPPHSPSPQQTAHIQQRKPEAAEATDLHYASHPAP